MKDLDCEEFETAAGLFAASRALACFFKAIEPGCVFCRNRHKTNGLRRT